MQEVVDGLASEGLDFETDIKPALGSELHLMVLDVPLEQGAELPAAALLRPDDGAKLVELLELVPDGRAAWRLVDGWYIVAMTQADIDRVVSGAGVSSLADNETFADLFRRITGEAVVRAYVAGSALSLARAAWAGAAGMSPETVPLIVGGLEGAEYDGAAIAVAATAGGVRLEGVARPAVASQLSTYRAQIPRSAPGSVVAFVSLHDLRSGVEPMLEAILQQNPDAEVQIGQFETFLGITLADDVLPLLEGESAIYVRSATPIPEITVVLSPEDPEAAVGMLSRLMALVATGMSPGAQQGTLELGEISARTLTIGDVVIHLAAVAGRLVLTTSSDGITDFAYGTALADDAAFTAARDAAGMPDETTGFMFVDFTQVWDLAAMLAGGQDAFDADDLAEVRALKDLLLYSTVDGDHERIAGLIRIE